MTAEELKALDQKRKDREDELVLLLLLLLGYGLTLAEGEAVPVSGVELEDAAVAIRASKRAQAGSLNALARLLRRFGIPEIAESMADAHLDAFDLYRPGADRPDREALADQYHPAAAEMVTAMLETLEQSGGASLAEALLLAKYSRSDSTGLELGAERQIVTASNAGLLNGAFVKYGRGGVPGLRHVSVIDDRTTKICTERDGLQLPPDDPYWLLNWPSLHWRCRSVVVPIIGSYRASNWRPRTPPDVGFGRAPAAVRKMLRRLAA